MGTKEFLSVLQVCPVGKFPRKVKSISVACLLNKDSRLKTSFKGCFWNLNRYVERAQVWGNRKIRI